MTNMIITPNQTQSTCPEDPDLDDVVCQNDSDCQHLEAVKYGHGKYLDAIGLLHSGQLQNI